MAHHFENIPPAAKVESPSEKYLGWFLLDRSMLLSQARGSRADMSPGLSNQPTEDAPKLVVTALHGMAETATSVTAQLDVLKAGNIFFHGERIKGLSVR